MSRLFEIDLPRRLPLNAPRDAQVRAALGLLGELRAEGVLVGAVDAIARTAAIGACGGSQQWQQALCLVADMDPDAPPDCSVIACNADLARP